MRGGMFKNNIVSNNPRQDNLCEPPHKEKVGHPSISQRPQSLTIAIFAVEETRTLADLLRSCYEGFVF